MNKLLFALALAAPLAITAAAEASPIFPAPGASTGGPAIIFTFTPTGITTTFVSSQTYDGSDDAFIGVVNNSGVTQTSLNLSGSGNGGGIFAFDGDGIIHYVDANTGKLTVGNPSDPTGYGGPGVTFSNYSSANGYSTGTVNFNIASGGTAYFGLESSPNSIMSGGGLGVPEPVSIAMLGTGLLGLGLAMARRRA